MAKKASRARREVALAAGVSCALIVGCKPEPSAAPPVMESSSVHPPGLEAGMDRQQPQVDACVAEGREHDPSLEGTMMLNFVITTAGEVEGVKIREGQERAPDVAACITDAVARWTFPGIDEIDPGGLRMTVLVDLAQ